MLTIEGPGLASWIADQGTLANALVRVQRHRLHLEYCGMLADPALEGWSMFKAAMMEPVDPESGQV